MQIMEYWFNYDIICYLDGYENTFLLGYKSGSQTLVLLLFKSFVSLTSFLST